MNQIKNLIKQIYMPPFIFHFLYKNRFSIMLSLIHFLFYWLEREREEGGRERENEKHQSVACTRTPTRDQTSNMGICPDLELNPPPLDVWDDAPTNFVYISSIDRGRPVIWCIKHSSQIAQSLHVLSSLFG